MPGNVDGLEGHLEMSIIVCGVMEGERVGFTGRFRAVGPFLSRDPAGMTLSVCPSCFGLERMVEWSGVESVQRCRAISTIYTRLLSFLD